MNPSLQTVDLYEQKPYYRWLALIAALLAWGFDGVEQGVYAIMTRQALKDLIPDSTNIEGDVGFYYSLSVAMWLWGAAAGGVIFGRMGDRFGRVRSLLISVTTYSCFTGLSAFSTHWSHLMVFRFFGAIGLGGTWPLAVALVMETWPENRRGVLAGSIGAAANVGILIASLFSRLMLAHQATWRWVIGMGFFIGIASLPIIMMVPEPTQWRRSRAAKQKSSLREVFTPQYRRSVIVGSLLSTVALLGAWGSFLWLATFVDHIAETTPHRDSAKAIVSQYASYGQIFGGFLGGMLAGWMGNKKAWCFLCITAWVSVSAMFGLNKEYGSQVVWMAVVAGIFVTAFFGWLPKYLPELFPTRIRATGQGFSYNIGRVLAGFGVLGTGTLVSLFHGDYGKGAMTMATIYLVGLVVILFARDTGGKMISEEVDMAAKDAVPQSRVETT